MAAASPEPWYQRLILSPIRQAFSRSHDNEGVTLTEEQRNALGFESADLSSRYKFDEKQVAVYKGLVFDRDRQEWLARFEPAHPERTADPSPDDATYAEVLRRGRLLHHSDVKPSQSFKALAALNAKLDHDAAKLHFDN